MRWTPFFQISEIAFSYLFAGLVGVGVSQSDWWSVGMCAVFGFTAIIGASESIVRKGWLGRRA